MADSAAAANSAAAGSTLEALRRGLSGRLITQENVFRLNQNIPPAKSE